MCRGNSLDLFQKPGPFSCQLQLLASTILQAALARNQAFGFELVEQYNQAAGHHPEVRGEFALILPSVGMDPAQHAQMWRGNAESCDLAAEGKRCMCSEL